MPEPGAGRVDRLREVFNDSGFPAILDPLAPTPNTAVDPPDPAVVSSAGVAAAADSILKVRATAESCARRMEGTGFVIGPDKVLTNAHVVAGSDRAVVESAGGNLEATVVLYDSQTDLAVLDVPDLTAPALAFAAEPAASGADAIVAGYPAGRPLHADPGPGPVGDPAARAEHLLQRHRHPRGLHAAGAGQAGQSGGPLLAPDGTVLGVIFGAAIDETDVGFALTAAEVAPVVRGRSDGRVGGLHPELHRGLSRSRLPGAGGAGRHRIHCRIRP